MSSFLETKINNLQKAKRKSDRNIKIFLIVFILGYLFFFLTGFLFPRVYKGKEVTHVGQSIDMENYIFQLDSWDYAENDNAFEIILEAENLTLNEKPEYLFTCKDGDNIYRVNIHKQFGKYIILRVSGLKNNWAEIAVTINADDKQASISTNYKVVNKIDTLKDRSEKEYIAYAKEQKILGMENEVKSLEEKNKDIDNKIAIARDKIKKLEEEIKTGTDSEKETTKTNIEKINTSLDEQVNLLAENNGKIKDLQSKIKKLKDEDKPKPPVKKQVVKPKGTTKKPGKVKNKH